MPRAADAVTRPVFPFTLERADGAARAGVFGTPHGDVATPAFMPVGTLASVKALDPDDLHRMGARMVLANAYHLHLRPGDDEVAGLGGLHRFMGWSGPILTDSGGFQVFSLETLRTVTEEGVAFRSHIDGSARRFTPEEVMRIEWNLGADVIMQFDHVVPGQADRATARDASERSLRWLARCQTAYSALERGGEERGVFEGAGEGGSARAGGPPPGSTLPSPTDDPFIIPSPSVPFPRTRQALFPIAQGGIHADLRLEAARAIASMDDWAGVAIGGLSVGEAKPDMYAMLEVLHPALPMARPRYLMGVGFPEDLVEGVRRGVDLFDCVAPTRMGRNGTAFTRDGRLNIKRAECRGDAAPIDDTCTCHTCRRFSRAYLRHLYVADEMLGLRLLSLHNVHFLTALMRDARTAILTGTFAAWSEAWLSRYHSRSPSPE